MSNANVKQQAHELIDKLPDNATWDEIATGSKYVPPSSAGSPTARPAA